MGRRGRFDSDALALNNRRFLSLLSSQGSLSGANSVTVAAASSVAAIPAGSAVQSEAAEVKGWLYKWTNYVRGYQKRWFVLSNGLLSYYRSQGEMAYHSRASIALSGASIQVANALKEGISSSETN